MRDPDVPCHVRPSDSSLVDYAKVREHTFENLILLCANGHARVTAKEIDTLSVKQFKANLSVVMQRCGDLERRVLELLRRTRAPTRLSCLAAKGYSFPIYSATACWCSCRGRAARSSSWACPLWSSTASPLLAATSSTAGSPRGI